MNLNDDKEKYDFTKNKKFWTDEEWDESSALHRLHKEIAGYTMNQTVMNFYIIVFIVSLIGAMLFN